MTVPLLATKLAWPAPRPYLVRRLRLLDRVNAGVTSRLTLLSAPAGFGKTTLLAAWLAELPPPAPVAWLSLEPAERDPTRFLTYLLAALHTLAPSLGAGLLPTLLASPLPPPPDLLLAPLLGALAAHRTAGILVLDDYHAAASPPVDQLLTRLLDHLPPTLHLILATRHDPALPLARLRARNQLLELRAADLRFTPQEATTFLTQTMGLTTLAPGDLATLSQRTDGWIAGLHLAALSLADHPDPARLIAAFSASHRFVLDYLLEEVLDQQPPATLTFLRASAILDRLTGPLCDALLATPPGTGQALLEQVERANLFLLPVDQERRWYRYHALFVDLLRQRLLRPSRGNAAPAPSTSATGTSSTSAATGTTGTGDRPGEEVSVAELHQRASGWFEAEGMALEAFTHAVAAADLDRAARLLQGQGMPLHFRGAVTPVLDWLASLPTPELDARPALWVMFASALSMTNRLEGVEEKLQAAEAALAGADANDATTRNLIGHIAAIRALLAGTQYDAETIIAQSRRALEYLHPDNLPVRTATVWKLGFAHQLQGDRAAAAGAYAEAIAMSQASGNAIIYVSASTGLANVQETENLLSQAAETYRHILQVIGEAPSPVAEEAHFGLARISYEWNDLEAAREHAEQSLHLARPIENTDRFVTCQVFLARLKLAGGDETGTATLLAEAEQTVRQRHFTLRKPEVAAAQVLLALHQGHLAAAARHADAFDLPLSQARVRLAQGKPADALAVLVPWKARVDARGWTDEQLKVLVLEAVAHEQQGHTERAVQVLLEALALAEPAGCIRTFVDEGAPMARLLAVVAARGVMPGYVGRLRAAWAAERQPMPAAAPASPTAPLIEPLSRREVEVLQLIAQGRSNEQIAEQLFLTLNTVKGHNRKIFGKLQVQRRTEAVARARELDLL